MYAEVRAVVCTVDRMGSCMVRFFCQLDFPLDVPYGWGAKLCRDDFRLLIAWPVVDRLSIWPGGGSPCSPVGINAANSVFGSPP